LTGIIFGLKLIVEKIRLFGFSFFVLQGNEIPATAHIDLFFLAFL
jgi:hypothetical protein